MRSVVRNWLIYSTEIACTVSEWVKNAMTIEFLLGDFSDALLVFFGNTE